MLLVAVYLFSYHNNKLIQLQIIDKLRLAYNDAVSSFLTPFSQPLHWAAVFRTTFKPWQ